MPTGDQGLILPGNFDLAAGPTNFTNYNTGVESRLVKRYTSTADRTTRNPAPATNELSIIGGVVYVYTGGAWVDVVGTSAWTDYSGTLTWATTGVAPAIGNGALVGAYRQTGKTVTFRIYWVAGGTTTFGSGNWLFSLPATALNSPAGLIQTVSAQATDTSVPTAAGGSAIITAASDVFRIYLGASNTGVSNTVPWTWASGDSLVIGGTYEIA